MKKIYEKPVVELTVFDVEDVITLSIIDTTQEAFNNEQALNKLQSEISAAKQNYNVRTPYKW